MINSVLVASTGWRSARILAAAGLASLLACGGGGSSGDNQDPARPVTASVSLVQPVATDGGRAQVIVSDYSDPVIAYAGNVNADYSYVTASYQMQADLLATQAPAGIARSLPPLPSASAHGAPPHDALTALDTLGALAKDLVHNTNPPAKTRSVLPHSLTLAPADALGDQQTFWTLAGGRFVEVTATCQQVGDNVYVYVDNDTRTLPPDPATLAALVDTWDRQIYPGVRSHFGTEWQPGIDDDNRITILISPAIHNYVDDGTLGYFWPGDEYTPEELVNTSYKTNQREMLYMTDRLTTVPAAMIYGILAHEFQHMVSFYQRYVLNGVSEDVWLDEGLSMLAMQLAGFGMPQGDPTTTGWVNFFLNNPSFYTVNGSTYPNSLVLWNGANYGQGYLFLLYLYEQYGGDGLLWQLMNSRYAGIRNVEIALGRPFASLYNEWLAALYLDGRTQDTKYNFVSIDLQGTYIGELETGLYGPVALPGLQVSKVTALPATYSGNPLPPWTAEFIEFDGNAQPGTLDLRLDDFDASLGPYLINLRYR